MVKMLIRKLDVNGDGSVTKSELISQWNSFSADLFQLRTDGALDCSIMWFHNFQYAIKIEKIFNRRVQWLAYTIRSVNLIVDWI